MNKISVVLIALLLVTVSLFGQEIPAYYKVGNSTEDLNNLQSKIKTVLTDAEFEVLGEYHPADNQNQMVICYTSEKLKQIAIDYPDRGALAAVLKIALKKEGGQVEISMINPTYLFYAYFVENLKKHEAELLKISEDAKQAMKKIGPDFTPFGGALEKDKLQKYRYKVMMPYFTDAEKLTEFSTFEEGLKIIQANLKAQKGNTEQVYSMVFPDKKVAVFGVGLKNKENGEAKFLPIIGDKHIAAMPYEMILQGNTVSILPGRYRIALHWPEITK